MAHEILKSKALNLGEAESGDKRKEETGTKNKATFKDRNGFKNKGA